MRVVEVLRVVMMKMSMNKKMKKELLLMMKT